MKKWLLKWGTTLLVRLVGVQFIALGVAGAYVEAQKSSWAMVANWWRSLCLIGLIAIAVVFGLICLCGIGPDD